MQPFTSTANFKLKNLFDTPNKASVQLLSLILLSLFSNIKSGNKNIAEPPKTPQPPTPPPYLTRVGSKQN